MRQAWVQVTASQVPSGAHVRLKNNGSSGVNRPTRHSTSSNQHDKTVRTSEWSSIARERHLPFMCWCFTSTTLKTFLSRETSPTVSERISEMRKPVATPKRNKARFLV